MKVFTVKFVSNNLQVSIICYFYHLSAIIYKQKYSLQLEHHTE